MARKQLSLDTLGDFDFGRAAVAFQKALEAVVRDCTDRPGDKHARTVELKASIVPVMLQDGDVVDVEVDFQIRSKVPAWQTAARPLNVSRNGQLFFEEFAPDNPNQMTLDEQQ